MSMLAERRFRKSYVLQPRGKPLYEDANHFGTKMLEKMGWSKGKGLGAKENGNPEFVHVKYKSDNAGFGYADRNDGWTKHEENFEGFLKSLSNSAQNSDTDGECDSPSTIGLGFPKSGDVAHKLSIESLEEKSKNSRARVHYKKFTRSKDLSQYSEKDLANIFGKKNLNVSVNKDPEGIQEDNKNEPKDNEMLPSFGVTTINAGTSISDYFKNKMGQAKDTSRKHPEEQTEDISSNSIALAPLEEEIKKSKKCKKNREKKPSTTPDADDPPAIVARKKTKKRDEETKSAEIEVKQFVKKSKKRKNKDNDLEEENCAKEQLLEEEDVQQKCKRTKTNAELGELENSTTKLIEEMEQNTKKRKKHKKTKVDSNENNEKKGEQVPAECSVEQGEGKKDKIVEICAATDESKKSKNHEKNSENFSTTPSSQDSQTQNGKDNEKDLQNSSVSESFTYTLTAYGAELFRHTDINGFDKSNLQQIIGYGLSENISLVIENSKFHEQRIAQLWSDVIKKSKQLEKTGSLQGSRKINLKRLTKRKAFFL